MSRSLVARVVLRHESGVDTRKSHKAQVVMADQAGRIVRRFLASDQDKVFLGGTCGKNDWREGVIESLVERGVDQDILFNPVVKDWNAAAQEREERVKRDARVHVYYIANPKEGDSKLSTYSMIEATMALYDRPTSTVVVFDPEGITGKPRKSFDQIESVLRSRFPGAAILDSIDDAVEWLVPRLTGKLRLASQPRLDMKPSVLLMLKAIPGGIAVQADLSRCGSSFDLNGLGNLESYLMGLTSGIGLTASREGPNVPEVGFRVDSKADSLLPSLWHLYDGRSWLGQPIRIVGLPWAGSLS